MFFAACTSGTPTGTGTPNTTGTPTSAASGSGEPIKIGIIADLTGPFTTYGTSLANSAQLAIKEINAKGGIGGRQITVIVEDTQTDVSATVDKARKLVQSDKVDLVMGPIGSDANDAAYKTVVTDGGEPLFYTETFEGGKCNDLYFSFGAVPAQQIRPLIPVLQGSTARTRCCSGPTTVAPPGSRSRSRSSPRTAARWSRSLPAPHRGGLQRVRQNGARQAAGLHLLALSGGLGQRAQGARRRRSPRRRRRRHDLPG